jgi:hypothetical protein
MRNRLVRRKVNIAASGDARVWIGLERSHDHRHAYPGGPSAPHRKGGPKRPTHDASGPGRGGCRDAGFSRHPEIAAAMRDRGMNQEEVKKMCSGNWLRVPRAVRA